MPSACEESRVNYIEVEVSLSNSLPIRKASPKSNKFCIFGWIWWKLLQTKLSGCLYLGIHWTLHAKCKFCNLQSLLYCYFLHMKISDHLPPMLTCPTPHLVFWDLVSIQVSDRECKRTSFFLNVATMVHNVIVIHEWVLILRKALFISAICFYLQLWNKHDAIAWYY